MNNKVAVLIIAHKQHVTEREKISLQQCVKILSRYPIYHICPAGLDSSEYEEIIPGIKKFEVEAEWLSNYQNFNAFKLSPLLYENFNKYEYILFYEPDCFVFKDELTEWCNKGLDYIGSPWTEGWGAYDSEKITGVGNGGFSLRKTASHLKIAKQHERNLALYQEGFKNIKQRINFLQKKQRYYIPKANKKIEDTYWCFNLAKKNPDFKIASKEVAVKFSFEASPSKLYKLNNSQLPFGCHAWHLYDLEFWKPHIEQFGYIIPEA